MLTPPNFLDKIERTQKVTSRPPIPPYLVKKLKMKSTVYRFHSCLFTLPNLFNPILFRSFRTFQNIKFLAPPLPEKSMFEIIHQHQIFKLLKTTNLRSKVCIWQQISNLIFQNIVQVVIPFKPSQIIKFNSFIPTKIICYYILLSYVIGLLFFTSRNLPHIEKYFLPKVVTFYKNP